MSNLFDSVSKAYKQLADDDFFDLSDPFDPDLSPDIVGPDDAPGFDPDYWDQEIGELESPLGHPDDYPDTSDGLPDLDDPLDDPYIPEPEFPGVPESPSGSPHDPGGSPAVNNDNDNDWDPWLHDNGD